jgi:hypothetical protein
MNWINKIKSPGQLSVLMDKLGKLDEFGLYQVSQLADRLDLVQEKTKLGKTSWYNFRYENDWESQWKPKLAEQVDQYKTQCENKMTNPDHDLVYRSRYSPNVRWNSSGFIKIFSGSTQSIVPSDFIMFNKNFKLSFLDVDRLLPYCKFKSNEGNNEQNQLDGWVYKCFGLYHAGSGQSNKQITWSMDNYNELPLLKTEEEKRLAVRAMLQIMNECDEEQINLYNYHVIGEWYHFYDAKLNSYNGNSYEENKQTIKSNISIESFKSIPINKLMAPNAILNLLYSHAKSGSSDRYIWFGRSDKPVYIFVKPGEYVGTIGPVTINTTISDDLIDLRAYAQANGIDRAQAVRDLIDCEIKDKINCSQFTKSDGTPLTPAELIVAIYNNSSKYNMGWLDQTQRTLTVHDAEELLANSSYIDYLDGKAIKMSFETWPIIDTRRFADRNGPEHLTKCVKTYTESLM